MSAQINQKRALPDLLDTFPMARKNGMSSHLVHFLLFPLLQRIVNWCGVAWISIQIDGCDVVQRPLGHSARKGLHPNIADGIMVQPERLKAWLQGTGAPAHLQLVQRPSAL